MAHTSSGGPAAAADRSPELRGRTGFPPGIPREPL